MKTENTTSFGRLKHNTIRNKKTAESNRLVALGGDFFSDKLPHLTRFLLRNVLRCSFPAPSGEGL